MNELSDQVTFFELLIAALMASQSAERRLRPHDLETSIF